MTIAWMPEAVGAAGHGRRSPTDAMSDLAVCAGLARHLPREVHHYAGGKCLPGGHSDLKGGGNWVLSTVDAMRFLTSLDGKRGERVLSKRAYLQFNRGSGRARIVKWEYESRGNIRQSPGDLDKNTPIPAAGSANYTVLPARNAPRTPRKKSLESHTLPYSAIA